MEKLRTELTDSIKTRCNEIIRLIRESWESSRATTAGDFWASTERCKHSDASNLWWWLHVPPGSFNIFLHVDSCFYMCLLTWCILCFVVQRIKSLSNTQRCENSPIVHLSRHGLFEQVRKSISDRKDKITDLLEENWTQLSEKGQLITLTQFENLVIHIA